MITQEKVLELYDRANPVSDVENLKTDIGAASYLATLEQRSSDMTQLDTKQTETTSAKRSMVPWLIAAGVAAVIGVAVILASQNTEQAPVATTGPVTIETDIDRSATPRNGTFEVTVGADLLGCSSGTVVMAESGEVMTCESGPNTGTFTMGEAPPDPASSEIETWSFVDSSGDFTGLQGEGRISVVLPSPTTLELTFTGDIEYTP